MAAIAEAAAAADALLLLSDPPRVKSFAAMEGSICQEAFSIPPASYSSNLNDLGYYQSLLMGSEDLESENIGYGASQFGTPSQTSGIGMFQTQNFADPNMRHFEHLQTEESLGGQEAYSSNHNGLGYFQSLMMGSEDLESENIGFGASHFGTPSPTSGIGMFQTQNIANPNIKHFEHLQTEESLGGQEAYSSNPNGLGYFQNLMMEKRASESKIVRHSDSQFGTTCLIPGNGMLQTQQFADPNIRHFKHLQTEEALIMKRIMEGNDLPRGSNNQQIKASSAEEPDLEIKI